VRQKKIVLRIIAPAPCSHVATRDVHGVGLVPRAGCLISTSIELRTMETGELSKMGTEAASKDIL
jgi:hypothetical protein